MGKSDREAFADEAAPRVQGCLEAYCVRAGPAIQSPVQ